MGQRELKMARMVIHDGLICIAKACSGIIVMKSQCKHLKQHTDAVHLETCLQKISLSRRCSSLIASL